MNTEKAKNEVKKLLNCGLKFDYDFDYNIVNKLMFAINKEGCSIRDIISKLKQGEKITFLLNDGKTWNGKYGDECNFFYNNRYDGSIYWQHETYGDCVRVDSNMGSIQEWGKELLEKFCVKQSQKF